MLCKIAGAVLTGAALAYGACSVTRAVVKAVQKTIREA